MEPSPGIFAKLLAKISDAENLELCLNKCDIIDLCDIIDIDERSLLLIEDCVRRKCIKMSEDARELLVDKEFVKRPDLFKFAPGVRERIFSVVEALKKICKNSNIMENGEMMNNFGNYLLNQKRTHEISVSATNLNRYLAAHKSVFGISNLPPLSIEQPPKAAEPIKCETVAPIFIDLTDSPKKSSRLRIIDSEPTDPSYPSRIITEVKLEEDCHMNAKIKNMIPNVPLKESPKTHLLISENTTSKPVTIDMFDEESPRSPLISLKSTTTRPVTSKPANMFDRELERNLLNISENTPVTNRTSSKEFRESPLINSENTSKRPAMSRPTNVLNKELPKSPLIISENTTIKSVNNSNSSDSRKLIINFGRIPKKKDQAMVDSQPPSNLSKHVTDNNRPRSKNNSGSDINGGRPNTPISDPMKIKLRIDRKIPTQEHTVILQSINAFNSIKRTDPVRNPVLLGYPTSPSIDVLHNSIHNNKQSFTNTKNPEFELTNKRSSTTSKLNSPETSYSQNTRSFSRLSNSIGDGSDRHYSSSTDTGREKHRTRQDTLGEYSLAKPHEYATRYNWVKNDLAKYLFNYNVKIGEDYDIDPPANPYEEKNFLYICNWCVQERGTRTKIKFSSKLSGDMNYSTIQRHLEYHFRSYRTSYRSPLKRYHNDFNKTAAKNKKFN